MRGLHDMLLQANAYFLEMEVEIDDRIMEQTQTHKKSQKKVNFKRDKI